MIFTEQNSNTDDKPSRKKPIFPVNEKLQNYLNQYGREVNLYARYKDLLNFTYTVPIKNPDGTESAWEKVLYDTRDFNFLREALVKNYAILKTKGDLSYVEQLDVAAIDFCFFGNSQPFRIRIINRFNDNYDHYYIKQADASRIYGLELEHLLSPNRISYFTDHNTLMEDHIDGIPGDIFLQDFLNLPETNQIRLAKEFVKFNERCFTRLLGDMRSYNFVVSVTPDVLNYQYRIRAIDFDQQSYEGRKNLYLPQFFKENKSFVDVVLKHLNIESVEQYRAEEKTLMAFRLASAKYRMKDLLDIMGEDDISTPEKIKQLREELAEFFKQPLFLKCKTMGQIVKLQLKQILKHRLTLIPKVSMRTPHE